MNLALVPTDSRRAAFMERGIGDDSVLTDPMLATSNTQRKQQTDLEARINAPVLFVQ